MRTIICPVCNLGTGFYSSQIPEGLKVHKPNLLWQYSYPGEVGYISPRCERCFSNKRGVRVKGEGTKVN